MPLCRGQEWLALQGGIFWVRTELFEEGDKRDVGGPFSFLSGEIMEEEQAPRGAANRDSAVGLFFGGGVGRDS